MTLETPIAPRFDTIRARRGSNCSKWDGMEQQFGGLMHYNLGSCEQALADYASAGVYGYADSDTALRQATAWWMKTRHGGELDPGHVLSTNGMVNAIGLAIDAFSDPGDGVVIFTPVYHAFKRVIDASGRELIDCPLQIENGRHVMDFAAYEQIVPAHARIVILCSPHNPGGQVWRREELRGLADFAQRHDLIVLSDEIHHDLLYPGQTHIPMAGAAPEIADRFVMLTATT